MTTRLRGSSIRSPTYKLQTKNIYLFLHCFVFASIEREVTAELISDLACDDDDPTAGFDTLVEQLN